MSVSRKQSTVPRRKPRWYERPALRRGAAAGVVAGTALLLSMMTMRLVFGQDAWVPLKYASYPIYGVMALQPVFEIGPVVVGLLFHYALAIGWAVAFSWLTLGQRPKPAWALGALWGAVSWLVMYGMVLPLMGAGPVMRMTPPPVMVFQHALFGVVLALWLKRSQPGPSPLPFPVPEYNGTLFEPAEEHLVEMRR